MVHSRKLLACIRLRLTLAASGRSNARLRSAATGPLRDRLREGDVKRCLFVIVFALEFLQMAAARSATYVIDGFTLDQSVRRRQNFSSYRCEPGAFPGITECSRAQQRTAPSGSSTSSGKIMHTQDGTAVYLMANLSSAALNDDVVRKEIDALSNEFKAQPNKIERLPEQPGVPNSVIVVWGDVELRPLKPEDFNDDGAPAPIWPGIFLDPLGDQESSAKKGLPIYRMTGGPGYVYSASFDADGRGHRRYEAIDIARPLAKNFQLELQQILAKDRSRAGTDYGLWPDVATLTRHLALDTSPTIANQALDQAFAAQPSKKLRSHVWSLLPLGSVTYLREQEHSSKVNIYNSKTQHPGIRSDIQDFLGSNPSEPFNDFLYYTIGEFDKALQTNPNSVIRNVINYARGHELLQALLEDVPAAVKEKVSSELDNYSSGVDVGPVNSALTVLNWYPELYDRKLLVEVVPNFAERTAAIRPYFETVLRDKAAPHADDAAYMLGWLAYHQGQSREALNYLSQAMVVGNGDFKRPAAMRQLVRILTQYPPPEQMRMIEANAVLARQPAFWYAAARSAYRTFDFATAIQIGERGLHTLGVPIERLPASTDAQKITDAIKKIIPPAKKHEFDREEFDYTNAVEIPYIVEASRQILRYQNYLQSGALPPSDVEKKAKDIIVEYSMLLDRPAQPKQQPVSGAPLHKDLRQALNLIDTTLASVPRSTAYSNLREWLHYRKVRVLVQFKPASVRAAVATMEAEFPKGDLLDDALAEEIFAEGAALKDLNAAEQTFRKLVDGFPKGNALDNGYTWMAILYRCMGRAEEARKINADIVRLFPGSRHARLALQRMAHPETKACHLATFEQENP
jgi:tetratricopeptide (TPR) repeat protein